jgi:alanine dehydrogenase
MRVGIPSEVKNNEFRVAITPAGVHELVLHGHEVFVQRDAGLGSSITNEEYVAAGATILATADDVWGTGELILKVKEPIAEEYHRMRSGQTLFTYLHLAASRPCTDALVIDADLVIGAVLIPGAAAPHLVTRDMVKRMKPGSVLVDISIDQGGCFETSHATTHADPTYVVDDVIHYCVANMPGAVPRTSTFALNNATLPFARKLADLGWKQALRLDPHLANGLNVHEGHITNAAVAQDLGYPYVPVAEVLK